MGHRQFMLSDFFHCLNFSAAVWIFEAKSKSLPVLFSIYFSAAAEFHAGYERHVFISIYAYTVKPGNFGHPRDCEKLS